MSKQVLQLVVVMAYEPSYELERRGCKIMLLILLHWKGAQHQMYL